MGIINELHLRAVLPLVERERHVGLSRRLRTLEGMERMPADAVRARQWESLKALLQHAYDSCPFYRQRLESIGMKPQDMTTPAALRNLPPLTRDDLRNELSNLWSRRFKLDDLRKSATGGTTDSPVPFFRDVESLRDKQAVQIRFDQWAGFSPGDKVFYLWGAQSDYAQDPSWRWRLYDRHLMRRIWAQTSRLNPETMESHRKALNRLRPDVVYAYPTPLAVFCEYLRDCKKDHARPRAVICTAEALQPQQRELIREVMGVEPQQQYGSREFAMIAAECEHHTLHLNPAAAYMEFIPIEGAEEEGLHEVLITDLLNYGMPLIRYRSNDCAIPGDETCPCGRGYPVIQKIVGRTTEILLLPDGTRVPGVALTNRVLQVCPGLKKVQVIQETVSEFRIRYVPGPGFAEADLNLLRTNLRKFFPDGLQWSFEPVADIERERSGKTRFCISKVARSVTSGNTLARTS